MGDPRGFKGRLAGAHHPRGKTWPPAFGHLTREDVGHAGALVVAMQGDAAARGDGELPQPQFPALQGRKIVVEGKGAKPLQRQNPLGDRGGRRRRSGRPPWCAGWGCLDLMGGHHGGLLAPPGGRDRQEHRGKTKETGAGGHRTGASGAQRAKPSSAIPIDGQQGTDAPAWPQQD